MTHLSLLTQYIFHPIETLKKSKTYSPRPLAFYVLAMYSATSAVLELHHPMSSFFTVFSVIFLGSLIYVLAMSLLQDFAAQWLGYKAQSFTLFSWQLMTLLPYTLFIPIHLLVSPFGVMGQVIGSIASFVIIVYSIILNIKTIRHLYRATSFKAGLIFICPFLLLFVLFILASVLFVSTSFTFSSQFSSSLLQ